jgi:hypothetical protein
LHLFLPKREIRLRGRRHKRDGVVSVHRRGRGSAGAAMQAGRAPARRS